MSQKPLTLTDPEKLILVMLSDIQEHLKIKGEVDPSFIKEAIYSGNLWALPWEYSGLFNIGEKSEHTANDVVDYLDMWTFIEEGYESLSDKDKVWLEAEAKPFGKPRFTGFDGNDEVEYYSAARILIDKMHRFTRFLKRDLNCHHPSIATHRRMYAVFEPIRQTLRDEGMTAQQLAAVLKARLDA